MTTAQVSDQMRQFEERGLVLENRNSRRITMLDGTGEQIPATIDALIFDLASSGKAAFQFWLDDTSIDVFCEFRRLTPSILVQTYGLNGKTPDERLRVRDVVWGAFGRDIVVSDALIVDLYCRTEWVDWDQSVITGIMPTESLPELVVIRQGESPSHDDLGQLGSHYFRMTVRVS